MRGAGECVPVSPYQRTADFSSQHTYLLVGGVDGLVQLLAQWAVDGGAGILVLVSRNITSKASSRDFANHLRAQGCRVKLYDCDIAELSDLARVLVEVDNDMPPIRGVIQGAAVLEDSVFESMTVDQWHKAVRPKMQDMTNLASLLVGQPLDFFILLSSSVGIVGNASQANYGAAGAFQDAFATQYRTLGRLPIVSVDLGVVPAIGVASRTKGATEYLLRMGHRPLDVEQVLQVMEHAVAECTRVLTPSSSSSSRIAAGQIITGLGSFDAIDGIHWRTDARFLGLRRTSRGGHHRNKAAGASKANSGDSFREAVAGCRSTAEAAELVGTAVAKKLSEMFMIPETAFDRSAPLSRYGVDSLVAVELRNWLVAYVKADVSLFDVLQSPSLTELAEVIVLKSKLVSEGARG